MTRSPAQLTAACTYTFKIFSTASPISAVAPTIDERLAFQRGRCLPPAYGRFTVHQAGYEASVGALRDAMDQNEFDDIWTEGAALTTEEAIS
jgi:hypothetical protein